MRNRLVAFAVVGLLAVAGCKGRSKSNDNAKGKAPSPMALEGLKAVPASARVVIGANVQELAAADLTKRAVERMFAADPQLEGDLREVLRICEFSPDKDLKSAMLARLPGAAGGESLLVAKGRLSESAIAGCLGRFLQESGGRLESSSFEGRPVYHQISSEGPGAWLSFGSADTLLIASGREALELALGKGPKLADAKDGLGAYLGRVDTHQTVWAAGLLDPQVASGLVQATSGKVAPPTAMAGSLGVSEGLTLRFQVELANAEDAKTLQSIAGFQIQGAAALVLQSESAGALLKKIELSTEDRWLQLDWKLEPAEVAELVAASLGEVSETLVQEGDAGPSSGIDKVPSNDENPAPKSEIKGELPDGNRHPDASNEKDLRR